MNTKIPTSKSFVTRDYILNHNAVYGDCQPPVNKYVYETSQPVFARNCEPKIMYNCPSPTINRCPELNENINSNQLVYQNIQRGGMICDFKPRSEINTKIGSRFLSDPSRPPCEYVNDVETGFYLRHGESTVSSKCSPYWKERHRYYR